jgi:hypothetical protein
MIDLARLAVSDRTPIIGQQPSSDHPSRPSSRRKYNYQWNGMEQAPQLPGLFLLLITS